MRYNKIKIDHPRASSDAYTFEYRGGLYYVLKYKPVKREYYLWSVQEDPFTRSSLGIGRSREEAVSLAIEQIYRRLSI